MPSDCNELLKHGIFDEIITDTQRSFEEQLFEWLKTCSYEEFQKKKKDGLKFGADFILEELPVGFNLDNDISKEEFQRFQKYLSEGKIKKINKKESVSIISKTINEEALKTWLACMKIELPLDSQPVLDHSPDNISAEVPKEDEYSPGLKHNLIKLNREGSRWKLTLWYQATGEGDTYPIVSQFKIQGGTSDTVLKEGDVIRFPIVLIITRNTDDALDINVITNRGSIMKTVEETAPPQLNIQQFWFKRNTENLTDDIFCEVPKGYKIIGGGWSHYRPVGPAPFVFPESITKLKADTKTNDPMLRYIWFYVVAIFDPADDWEVNLFKHTTKNTETARVTIPNDYFLTSGWASFNLFDKNGNTINGSDPNTFNIYTSILSSYPVDSHTWEVELNKITSPPIQSYEVTALAIGVRPRIKNSINIEIKELQSHDYWIKWDGDILTGGGLKMTPPDESSSRWVYHLSCIEPESNSNPKWWKFSWSLAGAEIEKVNIIKYALGIKKADENSVNIIYYPPRVEDTGY
ncbi:hypothetical protein [Bacillus velezensis]|uniref:hypothetical protein n=1 Tax=Bacillus velezensis TaxID=492670 RepID=UPI000B44D67A|nr:hypothetical protein [Bacillus velezensis]POO71566.1 hypothetical protein C1T26_01935 [Bacillus amyloliquefaciens]